MNFKKYLKLWKKIFDDIQNRNGMILAISPSHSHMRAKIIRKLSPYFTIIFNSSQDLLAYFHIVSFSDTPNNFIDDISVLVLDKNVMSWENNQSNDVLDPKFILAAIIQWIGDSKKVVHIRNPLINFTMTLKSKKAKRFSLASPIK